MESGHLVLGVKDKTLEIVGTDISRLTFNGQPANTQSVTFKLTEQCTYLSSEGLSIEEFVTDDTNKRVWVIHISKHQPRRPVLAHKKAWQRIEDSLVEMTSERMSVILEEPIYTAKDWSAEIVPNATRCSDRKQPYRTVCLTQIFYNPGLSSHPKPASHRCFFRFHHAPHGVSCLMIFVQELVLT